MTASNSGAGLGCRFLLAVAFSFAERRHSSPTSGGSPALAGADGASALRQRVAPVARLVRAGRAVLEGRALAADRSHPTQLGSGRSHAVD